MCVRCEKSWREMSGFIKTKYEHSVLYQPLYHTLDCRFKWFMMKMAAVHCPHHRFSGDKICEGLEFEILPGLACVRMGFFFKKIAQCMLLLYIVGFFPHENNNPFPKNISFVRL